MNLIKYPDYMIKKWDKQVRNLMAYKLREDQYIGSAHWYLPNNNYGYNFFKLKDLQVICLPSNFLNYSANFIDKYANRATRAIFGESEVCSQTNNLLSKYKYHVVQNPAWNDELFDTNNPMKYCSNKALLMNLLNNNIDDIEQIIEDRNKLI